MEAPLEPDRKHSALSNAALIAGAAVSLIGGIVAAGIAAFHLFLYALDTSPPDGTVITASLRSRVGYAHHDGRVMASTGGVAAVLFLTAICLIVMRVRRNPSRGSQDARNVGVRP